MGIIVFLNNAFEYIGYIECVCSLTAEAYLDSAPESYMVCNSNLAASGGFSVLSAQSNLVSQSSLSGTARNLDYVYTGDGGVLTGGSATASFDLIFLFEIEYKTKASFEFTKEFTWNTGTTPLRWYRVLGCCKYTTAAGSGNLEEDPSYPNPVIPGGCDVLSIQTDDQECVGSSGKQQFVQNIAARSVADVCEQLKKTGMRWEICSLKRWSRPVEAENYDDCNILTEIPFSDIPECIEFSLVSDDVVKVGVKSFIIDTIKEATGTGGVVTGGSAITSSSGTEGGPAEGQSSFEYFPDGLEVIIGGSADTSSSWQTEFVIPVGVSAIISNLEINYNVVDANDLSIIGGTVATNCGSCTEMPQTIYMHHNFANNNIFSQFLTRNGLTASNPVVLNYSKKLKSWNGNFHLYGEGNDNMGSDESWRFTFEWTCMNEISGEELGAYSWKFSMLAVRKNEASGFDSDTRVLLVFPPDQICTGTQNLGFDFAFNLNTITKFVTNDYNTSPSMVLLNDKINLFKSAYWAKNPELIFRLSRNDVLSDLLIQDISRIRPTTNNLNISDRIVTR